MVHKSIKILLWLLGLMVTLGVMAVMGWISVSHHHFMVSLNQGLHHYQTELLIWRVLLMSLLITFYPKLIHVVCKRNPHLSGDFIEKISRRRMIVFALIIYELFIVHNVLGLLVNTLIYG